MGGIEKQLAKRKEENCILNKVKELKNASYWAMDLNYINLHSCNVFEVELFHNVFVQQAGDAHLSPALFIIKR